MNSTVQAPRTQNEANAPAGARVLVILGGIFSALVLIPTVPQLWVVIGLVLVPVVWITTGRKRKAMMAAAGCETKEQWNRFIATLPTEKQLKERGQSHTGGATRQPALQNETSLAVKRRAGNGGFVSPPRPELTFPHYRLLSPSFANYEVVGEAYREGNVIAALGGLQLNVEKTLEDVLTFLIPEPENPHDRNAVMVWMNGHHVGYLASEDAGRYRPYLYQVISAGYLPVVSGRLWGVARTDWEGRQRNHLYARVALNEPEKLFPTNNPPSEPYSLLPWGPAIQVTKESDYLAELTEHLHGADSYAIATLRCDTRTLKNGAVREFVSVHIDGDQVGELTPAMSEKVLPATRHLNDLDYEAAAWARVKGSALAIEVTIQAAKAHEIPDSWLDQVPVTIPALRNTTNQRASKDPNNSAHEPEQIQREQNWDF